MTWFPDGAVNETRTSSAVEPLSKFPPAAVRLLGATAPEVLQTLNSEMPAGSGLNRMLTVLPVASICGFSEAWNCDSVTWTPAMRKTSFESYGYRRLVSDEGPAEKTCVVLSCLNTGSHWGLPEPSGNWTPNVPFGPK